MILGAPSRSAGGPPQDAGGFTIDEVFRRHARRHPEALALADAANRETFTDHEPRRLTYAEADRLVTAIAGRLNHMGLPPDAVIGVQLPNIVETIVTMLGVLRAGMIVAPLPGLWRRADAAAALERVGAKALITCGRVGAFNHGQSAMTVAADVFSIRYVCGFGENLPDGIVSFDDLFTAENADPFQRPGHARQENATAHVAAITFDIADGGVVPIARNHAELLAGGLAVLLEGQLAQDSRILSTIAPSSFAGICLTLLPWLLCGGTLVLHHPFDAGTLAGQLRDDRCGALIVPGPAAFHLAEEGAFATNAPPCIMAAWRSPELLANSPLWGEPASTLVDISIFGETALVPLRRGVDGKPSTVPLGPVTAPGDGAGGVVVAEITRTDAGTISVRGPMVPHNSFPPGIEHSSLPHLKIGPGGLVDSGYTCRINSGADGIAVTGPPSGIVGVGGYRFSLRDLQEIIGRIDSAATVVALADPTIGQRLIGHAACCDTMQAALNAVGLNPIVAAAFADRSAPGIPVSPAEDLVSRH
jgi:acyl-CoA synthetase (AMP-forming)/AMP-acid ligase II